MSDYLAPREGNGPRCHIMDNDRHLMASWFHVGVSPHDVNSIRQGCHVVQVWGLHHDIQSMVLHHGSLSLAVYDDRFEGWHHTLTGEGDSFIQVDRILASISGKSLLWLQLQLPHQEAICQLVRGPGYLPLQWCTVHVRFFHNCNKSD